MQKLLVVDDNLLYLQELTNVLQKQGWQVDVADTGNAGLELLRSHSYDFILLDWNLPDCTGLDICRQYRGSGGMTPIIFLTARNTLPDKEAGLDAGGDDYLTKPFEAGELLARMRAIQRRPPVVVNELQRHGEFTFNPKLRTFASPSDKVQLSLLESSILNHFLRHRNQFFSSDDLLQTIWLNADDASTEAVRTNMKRLRNRLAKVGAEELIETVKGAGYILRDAATQ